MFWNLAISLNTNKNLIVTTKTDFRLLIQSDWIFVFLQLFSFFFLLFELYKSLDRSFSLHTTKAYAFFSILFCSLSTTVNPIQLCLLCVYLKCVVKRRKRKKKDLTSEKQKLRFNAYLSLLERNIGYLFCRMIWPYRNKSFGFYWL